MASKNISIKKKLYDQLKLRKKQGESFSDIIERLLIKDAKDNDISVCVGSWRDIPDDAFKEMEQHRKKMRKSISERFQ